jgi:hypothetical protein
MTRRMLLLASVAGLAGCTAPPGPRVAPDPSGFPPLPRGLGLEPGRDPVYSSLLYTSSAFAAPARGIGANPPYAARLVGMVEYLTAMILIEPRFQTFPPLVQPTLAEGRAELRAAFGISETASPQSVIDAFAGASASLEGGDRAAAEASLRPIVADPARTVATLGAVPFMPKLSFALSYTLQPWGRMQGIRLR